MLLLNPKSPVLVLAATVAGYWLLLYAVQRSVLFPVAAIPRADGAGPPMGIERVWLRLAAGPVETWFLPALARDSEPSPVVIFAHGNAELIDFWADEFEAPRQWGLAVLLVEYPGYGRSQGKPSQASITAAMLAAHEWAAARPDLDPRRIVAYGRSVGGGAACALAREKPIAALVLESTFTSARRMARRYALPGFLVRDPFDNLSVVRGFPGPVLIVHGVQDDVIAARHARALHQAARSAELHLLPCGHNDCPRPWPLLRRFLLDRGILRAG